MSREQRTSRKKIRLNKKKRKNRLILLAILILIIILAVVIVSGSGGDDSNKAKDDGGDTKQVESTITIGSGGDILIHSPFVEEGTYRTDDGYDFASCFKYIKSNYESYDYMVMNLEVTLAADGYSGYPAFRTPDIIADNLADAGVNLFLLANNHINDSGEDGFIRTMKVLKKKGYDYTGARLKKDSKRYLIKDIGGIKVGFINYTFDTSEGGQPSLNGSPMTSKVAEQLNTFNYTKLKKFKKEFNEQVSAMKKDGAEFIVFYPHFGEEYYTEELGEQHDVAEIACEAGVDALIGGHPHVVEPAEMWKSKDGKHKMFCAYSMGNQISNQRREYMDLMTGETEDGIIVKLEITRNSEGKTKLTDVDYTPVWTYKSDNTEYYILPADNPEDVAETTGLGIADSLRASKKRTYNILGKDMKSIRKELKAEGTDKNQND